MLEVQRNDIKPFFWPPGHVQPKMQDLPLPQRRGLLSRRKELLLSVLQQARDVIDVAPAQHFFDGLAVQLIDALRPCLQRHTQQLMTAAAGTGKVFALLLLLGMPKRASCNACMCAAAAAGGQLATLRMLCHQIWACPWVV